METPLDRVLASLGLEDGDTLVFVRTGSRHEEPRVARTSVLHLIGRKVWIVSLVWSPDEIAIYAREAEGG